MQTSRGGSIVHPRRGHFFKPVVFVLLAGALVLVANTRAWAHIKNEESQFPDIEGSPYAADIVMLVGLDLIPQTPVFEPDRPLTFENLAVWAALAHNLGEGGENPDTVQLAQAALVQGLVPSLDGEATYADLNKAIFDGVLSLPEEQLTAVPTRAEAAGFIAQHVTADLGDRGGTLLSRLEAELGPTGTVTKVEVKTEGDQSVTFFTIGDTTLPVDPHGRVAFGPTDLIQWEGRYVVRSLVVRHEGEQVLSFAEAGEPPQQHHDRNDEPTLPGTSDPQTDEPSGTPAEPAAGPNWLLYGLIAVLIILALVVFGRRRGGSGGSGARD